MIDDWKERAEVAERIARVNLEDANRGWARARKAEAENDQLRALRDAVEFMVRYGIDPYGPYSETLIPLLNQAMD